MLGRSRQALNGLAYRIPIESIASKSTSTLTLGSSFLFHVPSFSSRLFSSSERFVVSILGPPNAGKSTLFNRLQCKERNRTYRLGSSGKRKTSGRISSKQVSFGDAIVSPIAGTTRDRRECWGRIGGTEFTLMDTAGVDGDRIQLLTAGSSSTSRTTTTTKHEVERSMMEQTLEAAKQSDLILLMWDAKLGPTQDLKVTVRWLRKLGKDSIVRILANKLEGDAWAYDDSPVMEHIREVERLGLGDVIPISALQGEGIADIAVVIENLKAQRALERGEQDSTWQSAYDEEAGERKPLQMAILGRQNVGKSTLVNTLLDANRVLTGPTPGLTRDAISVEWMWEGEPIQLVDTAGIRKFIKRMDDSIEDMSVADALRAMKVAEVAVLVLDAGELFLHRQEIAICNAVLEEGRALVIAANKMDLLEMDSKFTPHDFALGVQKQLEERMPILRNTPIVPMSCISREGVDRLIPVVMNARDRWAKTFSTSTLNRWLKEVVDGTRPPMVKGVHTKLKYIIQTKGRPPTFIIFSNVDELPESYIRYLTRNFQDTFELYGMPVRIVIQKSAKENPFTKHEKKRGGFGLGGREGRYRRRVKDFMTKRRAGTKASAQ